jgi:hypothetical protein
MPAVMRRIATRPARRPAPLGLAAMLVSLAACASGPSPTPTLLELRTLSGSGVTGSVTLTSVGSERTLVSVRVDPAGHPDMPAHIHPGTCTDLVPQPRFPLENVVDGESVTEITATFDELFAGDLALNLHASSDDWETYTACAELTD